MAKKQPYRSVEDIEKEIKAVFLERLAALYASGKLTDDQYKKLQSVSVEDIQKVVSQMKDIGKV